MLSVALLYVLLRGGDQPQPHLSGPTGATGSLDQPRSSSVCGHPDACAAGASIRLRLGLGRAIVEVEQSAAGARMLGVALYLYVRDKGNIIVPTSPVELW